VALHDDPRPRLVRRLQERRQEHRRRSRIYRVGFALAGATVLLAGVVMIVTPGPAFVVIPAGLAMLAMEFAWAERALGHALARAHGARVRASRAPRWQRGVGVVAGLLAAAASLTLVLRLGLVPF
jgi:uncharacterized protein (TIGR02611 family)